MKNNGVCTVKDCGGCMYGKSGLCSAHYQRLRRRGTLEPQKRKYGTGTIHACGYHYLQVDNVMKAVHVRMAEKALGRPLPRGVVVHHANRNRLDNRPENLVICQQWYHKLIHQRLDAYDACGNPSWRKCLFCKRYDDPANLYIRNERYKTTCLHRACGNAYNLRRYHAKKAVKMAAV